MMDLNAYSQYTISQDVTTIKGATYKVTFQLNHTPSSSTNCVNYFNGFVQLIGVTSTGTVLCEDKKLFSHSKDSRQWVLQSFTFTAKSTNSRLQIGSSTPRACGPVIDDVKMVKAGYLG